MSENTLPLLTSHAFYGKNRFVGVHPKVNEAGVLRLENGRLTFKYNNGEIAIDIPQSKIKRFKIVSPQYQLVSFATKNIPKETFYFSTYRVLDYSKAPHEQQIPAENSMYDWADLMKKLGIQTGFLYTTKLGKMVYVFILLVIVGIVVWAVVLR